MNYFQGKNPDAYLQVALGHLHVRGDGDLGLLASDGHHFAQLTGLAVNLDAVVEKLLLKIKLGERIHWHCLQCLEKSYQPKKSALVESSQFIRGKSYHHFTFSRHRRRQLRINTYESSSVKDIVGNGDGAVHSELQSLALLTNDGLLLEALDGHP